MSTLIYIQININIRAYIVTYVHTQTCYVRVDPQINADMYSDTYVEAQKARGQRTSRFPYSA